MLVILDKNKKKNNIDDIEEELKKFEMKDPEPEEEIIEEKVKLEITIQNYVLTVFSVLCDICEVNYSFI